MKLKGTKNLTYTQRLQIETLLNAKHAKQEIAKLVGIHIRTLYYELKRGQYEHTIKRAEFWYGDKYKTEVRYSARIAQDRYDLACTAKGRPLKLGNDFALVNYIEQQVKENKISACAALGQIKRKKLPFTSISKTTLYRYIELGLIDGLTLQKRKQEKRETVAKSAPRGTSIEKRPNAIRKRKEFGHWEMDCVCGPTNEVLLNLTERMTRKVILFKMANQQADSVVHCLNVLERKYGKLFSKVFKTITVDNGSEFSAFDKMQRSIYGRGKNKRTLVYYCHPYSSWERGSNERLNREIRRLVPKGTNLSKLSIQDVEKVERWANSYPREVLAYATADELFAEQMSQVA